jgi:hypothetical protein
MAEDGEGNVRFVPEQAAAMATLVRPVEEM